MKNSLTGVTLLIAMTIFSCTKSDENSGNGTQQGIPESLHMAFNTPEWKRQIDCSHLDLFPSTLKEGVYLVYASSQSTAQSFMLSYPSDSSALVAASNLKKYPVSEFGTPEDIFEFSQKVPVNEASISQGVRLVSIEGFGEDVYNEIVEIKYENSEGDYARFRIKGRYAMKTRELGDGANETAETSVTGTYHLSIRADRK